jgi:hypothetical protein
LVDLISRELTGEALSRISSAVGEPEENVRAAADGIALAMVAALAVKASSSHGLGQILDMMKSSGFDGRAPLPSGGCGAGALTGLAMGGAPMLGGLFNGRQSAITEWLSSLAGIGTRSASMLLAIAAPAVLNLLGRQARQSGSLTSSALADFLGEQLGYLRYVSPQGLAPALGVVEPGRLEVPHAVQHAVSSAPVVKESSTTWWPWAALVALALLGLWWSANRALAGTIG